jgi:hypothetical protein
MPLGYSKTDVLPRWFEARLGYNGDKWDTHRRVRLLVITQTRARSNDGAMDGAMTEMAMTLGFDV